MIEHITGVFARAWAPIVMLFGLYAVCISGAVGSDLGVPNLFRDPDDLIKAIDTELQAARNSPVWNVFLFSPLLAGLVWTLSAVRVRRHRRRLGLAPLDVTPLNLIAGMALLSLIAFAAFLSAAVAAPPQHGAQGEILRAIVGLVMGTAITAALIWVACRGLLSRERNRYVELLVVGLPTAAIFVGILTWPRLVPAISIFALFGVLALVYFSVAISHGTLRIVLLAVVAFVAVWANWSDAKFRFRVPGVADAQGKDYYAASALLPLGSSARSGQPLSGVAPAAALRAWLTSRPANRPTPKLVIVTTSGGAYRAAFWTALVLDELQERAPELLDDLRLFTGASGGMVGAAYFVALRARGRACRVEHALLHDSYVGQLADETGAFATERQPVCAKDSNPCACGMPDAKRDNWSYIAGDTLSPVAQRLIQYDLWRLVVPGQAHNDRGRVLERQWRTLDRFDDRNPAGDSQDPRVFDFATLSAASGAGRAPSIIFSPTVLGTGLPLWISDLAVSDLLQNGKFRANDFFAEFNGARKGFRLSTATRLNASFPYASPGAALPTWGADRVGDAGYFDNYGGFAVAAYLSNAEIREWVSKNVSGIIILRLFAFDTTRDDSSQPVRPSLTGRVKAAIWTALDAVTGPLAGAASTRKSAMLERNTQELRLVRALYAASHPNLSFDVFDLAARLPKDETVSLSWYITPSEIERMRKSMNDLKATFEKIKKCWSNENPGYRVADPNCEEWPVR